jgi:hypothetical protein
VAFGTLRIAQSRSMLDGMKRQLRVVALAMLAVSLAACGRGVTR